MICRALRLAAALAAFPLLYVLAAVAGALLPAGTPPSAPQHEIALIAGPIHYDLLLPLDATTRARFGWLAPTGIALDHPEARWLVLGWGARDFYTTVGSYSDVTARAVWRGLTGDSAVMHVSLAGPLDSIPVRRLNLDDTQYARLFDAIEASFARGPATQPLPVPGLSAHDRFYPAKGRFNLFNTCNVWIGEVLRTAGVRFGRWTPLPLSVSLSHILYQSR